MKLPNEIEDRLKSLFELCKKHKVVKLFVFGSASKGDFNPEKSDLDLIVELDIPNPIEKGETLMAFWSELEALFKRKVDLLTEKSLRNPYLINEIENSKVLLYDRAS